MQKFLCTKLVTFMFINLCVFSFVHSMRIHNTNRKSKRQKCRSHKNRYYSKKERAFKNKERKQHKKSKIKQEKLFEKVKKMDLRNLKKFGPFTATIFLFSCFGLTNSVVCEWCRNSPTTGNLECCKQFFHMNFPWPVSKISGDVTLFGCNEVYKCTEFEKYHINPDDPRYNPKLDPDNPEYDPDYDPCDDPRYEDPVYYRRSQLSRRTANVYGQCCLNTQVIVNDTIKTGLICPNFGNFQKSPPQQDSLLIPIIATGVSFPLQTTAYVLCPFVLYGAGKIICYKINQYRSKQNNETQVSDNVELNPISDEV